MKIEISLTDFVEFVMKSGTPKLTLVKQIKNRTGYHPNQDYWKLLRDGIEQFHEANKDKKELEKILTGVTDHAKEKKYSELISAYKTFLGRKKVKWFEPPYKHWRYNDLSIKINPELGLDINGKNVVIKLYFKSEKITKNRVDIILTLLKKELITQKSEFSVALLDIRARKLYTDEKIDVNQLLPLLFGEALSFETIWKEI
jgi:hypothetical protein